jgi:putative hemolysin
VATPAERLNDGLTKHPLNVFKPFMRPHATQLFSNQAREFLHKAGDVAGMEFIDQILESCNVNYLSSRRGRQNIPATGRVLIVVNQPLGALEALALLRCIGEVRSDIKLASTGLLTDWPQLQEHLIYLDRSSSGALRRGWRAALAALAQEQVLIVCSAGRNPLLPPSRRKDDKWYSRLLRLAVATRASLLPVYMQGKILNNNVLHLGGFGPIGQRQELQIHPGEMVPCSALQSGSLRSRRKLLRLHLKRISKGKPGLLATEKTIIHPHHPQACRAELKAAPLLGETVDGQQIYLVDYAPGSAVMREIGRLREYTFRNVGEGTGQRKDIDAYDRYYRHLVLWNESNLEIVGAYRLGEAAAITATRGVQGLYCNELFEFSAELQQELPRAIELGRSFVQPKYWGKRSLEYLWSGIFAYLAQHPQVRYVYGPVSISNAYPEPAKQAIVSFYMQYFGGQPLACARRPYVIDHGAATLPQFAGGDYKEDFARLKEYLAFFDTKVPALYKQYTELFEQGGAQFFAFNVDPDFGYCVDGLVWVDLEKIKKKKREHYLPQDYKK